MDSPQAGLLVFQLITAPVSLAIAAFLNSRLRYANPTVRSYLWGYFICLQVGFLYLGLTVAIFYLMAQDQLGVLELWLLPLLIWVMVASVLRARTKHGWVVATIASLNPIVWAVNYVYGSKRWSEFSSRNSAVPESDTASGPAPSSPAPETPPPETIASPIQPLTSLSATQSATPEAQAPAQNVALGTELERMAQLYREGLLSPEEWTKVKSRLLG